MKIGMISDSLAALLFNEHLDTAAQLGIERVPLAGLLRCELGR